MGGLAQLVERLLSMQEVADSISAFSIFDIFLIWIVVVRLTTLYTHIRPNQIIIY